MLENNPRSPGEPRLYIGVKWLEHIGAWLGEVFPRGLGYRKEMWVKKETMLEALVKQGLPVVFTPEALRHMVGRPNVDGPSSHPWKLEDWL